MLGSNDKGKNGTIDSSLAEECPPMDLRKLKRLQRQLSKRTQGSHNYYKLKDKIVKLHYRIACIRQNTPKGNHSNCQQCKPYRS